jgi:hypothetical protein
MGRGLEPAKKKTQKRQANSQEYEPSRLGHSR